MDISEIVKRDAAVRPARKEVEEAVQRKLEATPERSYDNVLSGLRAATRGGGVRPDDTKGGTGGGTGGGEGGTGGGKDVTAPAPAKNLSIVATINAQQTVRGGANPGGSAFGVMNPTFSFRNVAHNAKDGKLLLTATMHCDYHWGVHALGRKDVPSGDAAFITAENYETIADDIDPDKGPHVNAPWRRNYWSQAATEAHELEHARDDWADWGAQNTGVTVAKGAWEAETVPADTVDAAITALQTQGGSGRHPGKIAAAVMADSDRHYGLPAGYHARAGEIKAHAVGAAIERPLAAAVRVHGKALAAAAAEKAKQKEAPQKADTKEAPQKAQAPVAERSAGRLGGAAADRTVTAIMNMFG